jgi:hypothetical protein
MFTCTRKKDSFKNLTVGKEYDGTEDGESIIVVNDAGYRARYAKDYFRSTEQTTTEAPRRGRPPRVQEVVAAPAPPPPPPPFDIERESTVEVALDGPRMNISLRALDVTNTTRLDYYGANISCGVRQISGMNAIGSNIDTFISMAIRGNGRCVSNDNGVFLANRIIEGIRAAVRRESAFVLMSDVVQDNDTLQRALNDHPAVNWSEAQNPNSGNVIRVWMIATSETE